MYDDPLTGNQHRDSYLFTLSRILGIPSNQIKIQSNIRNKLEYTVSENQKLDPDHFQNGIDRYDHPIIKVEYCSDAESLEQAVAPELAKFSQNTNKYVFEFETFGSQIKQELIENLDVTRIQSTDPTNNDRCNVKNCECLQNGLHHHSADFKVDYEIKCEEQSDCVDVAENCVKTELDIKYSLSQVDDTAKSDYNSFSTTQLESGDRVCSQVTLKQENCDKCNSVYWTHSEFGFHVCDNVSDSGYSERNDLVTGDSDPITNEDNCDNDSVILEDSNTSDKTVEKLDSLFRNYHKERFTKKKTKKSIDLNELTKNLIGILTKRKSLTAAIDKLGQKRRNSNQIVFNGRLSRSTIMYKGKDKINRMERRKKLIQNMKDLREKKKKLREVCDKKKTRETQTNKNVKSPKAIISPERSPEKFNEIKYEKLSSDDILNIIFGSKKPTQVTTVSNESNKPPIQDSPSNRDENTDSNTKKTILRRRIGPKSKTLQYRTQDDCVENVKNEPDDSGISTLKDNKDALGVTHAENLIEKRIVDTVATKLKIKEENKSELMSNISEIDMSILSSDDVLNILFGRKKETKNVQQVKQTTDNEITSEEKPKDTVTKNNQIDLNKIGQVVTNDESKFPERGTPQVAVGKVQTKRVQKKTKLRKKTIMKNKNKKKVVSNVQNDKTKSETPSRRPIQLLEELKKLSPVKLEMVNMNKIYTCGECDFAARYFWILKKHIMTHRKLISCSFCRAKLVSETSLQCHMMQHHSVKGHSCKQCPFRATTRQALDRHRASHMLPKDYSCKTCDFECRYASTLRNHELSHKEEKPFQCDHCGYSSADRSSLIRHILTHTQVKPYKCDFPDCGFASHTSYHIKVHKFSHTDEKPHLCSICGNRFKQRSSLKAHLLVHMGDKHISCKLCSFKCSRVSSMRRHMQSIHVDSERLHCDMCDFSTRNFRSYYKHKAIAHKDGRLYLCLLCDFKATNFRILLRHKGSHPRMTLKEVLDEIKLNTVKPDIVKVDDQQMVLEKTANVAISEL